MTYDSLRRHVVLFSGQPSSVSAKPEEKYLDDTWEWDTYE